MDKIKTELTAITEKHKKDFETEIKGDEVFETIFDITRLIDKYELNLKQVFSDIFLNQAKYINSNDKDTVSRSV